MKKQNKFLIGSLLSLMGLTPFAHAAKDDLLLQARLNQTSTSWLVDKTRLLMMNSGLKDFLSDTTVLDSDPIFTMTDISTDPKFVQIEAALSKTFKHDFSKAIIRIRIPHIYYKLATLNVNPKSFQANDPILTLQATALIQGIDIGLVDGLQVDVMIPNSTTGTLESYLTASLDPVSVSIPATLPPVTFDASFQTMRDSNFKFKLLSENLEKLPQYVQDHQKDFVIKTIASGGPLTANQIKVNPVIVKLNTHTRSIKLDEFKPIVQDQLPTILTLVFNALGVSLKETLGHQLLTSVFSTPIDSQLNASNENIYSLFRVVEFSQPQTDQLNLSVAGDLCTQAAYAQYKEACIAQGTPVPPVRTIADPERQLAKDEITAKLASGQADIGLSVSEEYLNRFLRTTIDAKMWNEMLDQSHLALGDQGGFVIFNQATQTPDFYLDVIYYGEGGIESVIINRRHPIHFPIRLSASFGFEIINGTPNLVIKTGELLSGINEIINGYPEFNLESHLVFGLKKKIARMIIKQIGEQAVGQKFNLELKMFSGLGLEKTWHETSPHGRLNLYFKI